MTTFFTGDLHLGHRLVATNRGFSSVGAHDAALLAQLYQLDPGEDEVFVLGDVSCGGPVDVVRALQQLRGVPTPMHLILGNHDYAHPLTSRAHEWYQRYAAAFTSVSIAGRTSIDTTEVLLSHFPYAGTPDRYARPKLEQWQLPDQGKWLIHGHTHASARRSGKRSICVSLEAWDLRLATEAEIAAEMRRR